MLASIRSFRTVAVALLLAGFASATHAESYASLAEWQYSGGMLLDRSMHDEVDRWSVQLGAGPTLAPRFEGASHDELGVDPLIEVRYRDRAFFSLGEGLGVNLIAAKTYRAGVAVTYDLGRDDHDAHHLHGLGDVDGAPEIKAFAEVVIFPFTLRGAVRKGFGGHDGVVADLSAYAAVAGNDRYFVLIGPSVTAASGRYMRHYFGVSATQSADSGLAQYDADAGLKSASFGMNAGVSITKHWFVEGVAAYARELHEAGRSPIVQTRNQHLVSIYLGYDF